MSEGGGGGVEGLNPITKKDNCFQYTVAAALNHEEIGKHAERTSKI